MVIKNVKKDKDEVPNLIWLLSLYLNKDIINGSTISIYKFSQLYIMLITEDWSN